ncbi:MAG: TrmH family RNA methyltransferase [Sumerlaeia bacterium]
MTPPAPDRFARWRVVLVSPQTAENVGAVARAMGNFGFRQLVVTEPRCDVSVAGPAGKLALAGSPILENARIVDSLAEALAPCHVSIALDRHEGEQRPTDFEGFLPGGLLANFPSESETALVFGREDHGLTTGEASLCAARWAIPTAADCPSLNLSHAVAVALMGVAAVAASSSVEESRTLEPVTSAEIQGLIAHLEQVLIAAEYQRPGGAPLAPTLLTMQRLALRAGVTAEELGILRGVCRRVLNRILGYERR